MKITYFTKYSRKGASSRLRSFQYFPLLKKKGFTVTHYALFGDEYLEALYAKKSIAKHKILGAYIRRFFQLFACRKKQIVVIEKELFPYFFPWAEQLLSFLGIQYFVDYDDAIFHNYDRHPSKIIQKLLGKKIDIVMKNACGVFAGNTYLAERAKDAGAKNITIVPTVIDLNRYQVVDNVVNREVCIGWIGSPSTFKYLLPLKKVFERLSLQHPIKIVTVGAKQSLGLKNIEEQLEWTEDSETKAIQSFDIGIMPLEDTPWEKGKCSYKLIQYMGCGLPVVASPVGMNNEVVNPSVNGFLATTAMEWENALLELINNPLLRKEMGMAGRRKVENEFNLKTMADKIAEIFDERKK